MIRNKKVLSWALYDWANSAYATTVMAGFFPVFFKQYWSNGADAVETTAKLGFTLSISSLMIAILSPTLGALADLRGAKKFLCGLFMVMGAATCFWLAFIPRGDWSMAMVAYGLGMFAFAASCVFYDAILPSIARGHAMDDASSLGYAVGYLGGGVLFLFNVAMYLKPQWFGLADGVAAVKFSFASVGVWWLVFSLPLFLNVPEPEFTASKDSLMRATSNAGKNLVQTLLHLFKNKNLGLFILAYWLYIDGVYTVMSMAVDYGMAIGLDSSHLIAALLLVQFVGFPVTWIFGKVTAKMGCRKPILFCIVIYAIAVFFATEMTTVTEFYMLAIVIGSVQGGVQSLSRSLFAHMAPADKAGEYFGLFNLIGKFASVIGPMIVAITVTLTGNSRLGMLGLLILFLFGGILLWKVREPRFNADGSQIA